MSARATAPLDAIILGGGAAGLFCAARAGRRGRRVLVLEHNREVGAKIVISGGGRCNFTNLETGPQAFLSANPHFCRSALARFSPQDFIALVRAHGIAFYEKGKGQLFCEGAGAAKKIVAMLRAECAAGDAEIRTGAVIGDIGHADGLFRVETADGPIAAPKLVIATGGLAIPKLGATDFGLRLARKFGLDVAAPAAALVPLTFEGDALALVAPLAGIGAPARVATPGGPAFEDGLLFTHRGLSGPAVLQASSYWRPGETLMIDLAPGRSVGAFLREAKRARPRALPATLLGEIWPDRLARAMSERLGLDRPLADLKDQALETAGRLCHAFPLTPSGDEGYAKAEVMRGGVAADELSSKTMEARKVPGLFVIGEAADVTGWLGGYNFQWAWASAAAAAEAL